MHLTLYISTDCKTTTQNLNEICLNKFSWGLKSLRILTPPHSPRFCLLVFRFLTAALESTSKTGSPAVHLFFHSVTDTHADRRVICSNSIHLAPVAVLSKVRVCAAVWRCSAAVCLSQVLAVSTWSVSTHVDCDSLSQHHSSTTTAAWLEQLTTTGRHQCSLVHRTLSLLSSKHISF